MKRDKRIGAGRAGALLFQLDAIWSGKDEAAGAVAAKSEIFPRTAMDRKGKYMGKLHSFHDI